MRHTTKCEIAVSGIGLLISALVWHSASQIPPSPLAQTGAGLIPQSVAVILAGLALIHLGITLRSPGRDTPTQKNRTNGQWRVAAVAICLCALILSLDLKLARFEIASALFVFFSVLILSGMSLRALVWASMVALFATGLTVLIFTKVFTVILP